MKVKLLVPICGPEGSFQAGADPDLSNVLAEALIKDGFAVSVEVPVKVPIKKEVVLKEIKEEVVIKNPVAKKVTKKAVRG